MWSHFKPFGAIWIGILRCVQWGTALGSTSLHWCQVSTRLKFKYKLGSLSNSLARLEEYDGSCSSNKEKERKETLESFGAIGVIWSHLEPFGPFLTLSTFHTIPTFPTFPNSPSYPMYFS